MTANGASWESADSNHTRRAVTALAEKEWSFHNVMRISFSWTLAHDFERLHDVTVRQHCTRDLSFVPVALRRREVAWWLATTYIKTLTWFLLSNEGRIGKANNSLGQQPFGRPFALTMILQTREAYTTFQTRCSILAYYEKQASHLDVGWYVSLNRDFGSTVKTEILQGQSADQLSQPTL